MTAQQRLIMRGIAPALTPEQQANIDVAHAYVQEFITLRRVAGQRGTPRPRKPAPRYIRYRKTL